MWTLCLTLKPGGFYRDGMGSLAHSTDEKVEAPLEHTV